ncbi:plasmid pRiA4b ORF-3 family protein [Hymenobacter nivis]|nr:plasmid pRiA4b ORF-3 family protein [Hymenobacter nivis]
MPHPAAPILSGTDRLAAVYQLKVHLLGISPQICRRVLVRGDTMLAELHHVFQVAMGCDVTTAINDRNHHCQGQKLSFLCLDQHPKLPVPADVASTIRLIDIVWFAPGTSRVVAAFEVEKSTSIYSGILRLTDLAFSMPEHETALYLIVPDAREKEVQAHLSRPAIRATGAIIGLG